MFDPDDVVFAWAMGKAVLIVIVSLGALVYLAWAVTRQKDIAADVGILKEGALRSRSPVKLSNDPFTANGASGVAEGARCVLTGTSAEDINVRESGRPASAA